MDNSLNYDEILASLKQKREWIEEAILVIERLARDGKSPRGRPPAWLAKTATADVPEVHPVTKKRTMSAAGRQAIGDATRKRWALKRAAEAAASRKTGPRKAKKAAAKKKATKKAVVGEL